MARVKRGVTTRAKHKRILDNAKGYYGRRKNTIRIARQAVEKAGQYAYRDRKVKKRSFRALWIQRINAAVRAEGLTYGQFIHALKLANIDLDRKVLADIAMHEAEAFSAIIAQAKAALPKEDAKAALSDRTNELREGRGSLGFRALLLWRDRLALERRAVPMAEVGGEVVGRLEEFGQHRRRIVGVAHRRIGQDDIRRDRDRSAPVRAISASRKCSGSG